MIKTLITYLPFYRIHEVEEYFLANVEALRPRRAVVYVDNVYTDRQLDILKRVMPSQVEVVTGNWRDRNTCFLTIIKDAIEHGDDALVLDSDNMVWGGLQDIDDELIGKYGFYTILDIEASERWLRMPRIIELGDVNANGRSIKVYGYKVAGLTHGIYFIGPKQGVRLSPWLLRRIDTDLLAKLLNALQNIEPSIRNFISDETTLGILLHYAGIRVTPFIIWSNHRHHGSTRHRELPILKALVATAHARFGRELIRVRRDRRTMWYFIRYKIAQLINGARILITK